MKRIIQVFAWSVATFGLVNMVLGMLIAFEVVRWPYEVPWFDVQDVKCSNDQVYVGIGYFSTVLVYDPSGRFDHAIPAGNAAKPFRFRVREDGTLDTRWAGPMKARDKPFQLKTRSPNRVISFNCSSRDQELHQHAALLIFAGPIPGGIIFFSGVLILLILYPRVLSNMFTRYSEKV